MVTGLCVEAVQGKGVRMTSSGSLFVNASNKPVHCEIVMSIRGAMEDAERESVRECECIEITGGNGTFRTHPKLQDHTQITRWFGEIFKFHRTDKADVHAALRLLVDGEHILGGVETGTSAAFLTEVMYELMAELPVALKKTPSVGESKRSTLLRSVSICN